MSSGQSRSNLSTSKSTFEFSEAFSQGALDAVEHLAGVLAGDDPPVHVDLALLGNDVDLGPAPDRRHDDRRRSDQRVIQARKPALDVVLYDSEHLRHLVDGVVALVGDGAVSRLSVGPEPEPRAPFVRHHYPEIGGFTDDGPGHGHVRVDEGQYPLEGALFVHGGAQDDVGRQLLGIPGAFFYGVEHRRQRSLRVASPAAIEPVARVGRLQRVLHAPQGDRVHVRLEEQGVLGLAHAQLRYYVLPIGEHRLPVRRRDRPFGTSARRSPRSHALPWRLPRRTG